MKQLTRITEDGRKVVEHVNENLIANALFPGPHSVSAYRAICERIEPQETDVVGGRSGLSDSGSALLRMLFEIQAEKIAQRIEV